MLTTGAVKPAALVVTADQSSRKGLGNMLQRNEIRDPMETMKMRAASPQMPQMPEIEDGLEIEKILRSAREIHRQHGGM